MTPLPVSSNAAFHTGSLLASVLPIKAINWSRLAQIDLTSHTIIAVIYLQWLSVPRLCRNLQVRSPAFDFLHGPETAVLGLLEEQRTRFGAGLYKLLIRGKKDGCKCGWGKTRSEKQGRLVAEYMPIKMLDTSMADIITKMEQVSTEDMENKFCTEKSSYRSYFHEPLPYGETLLGMLDAMKRGLVFVSTAYEVSALQSCKMLAYKFESHTRRGYMLRIPNSRVESVHVHLRWSLGPVPGWLSPC